MAANIASNFAAARGMADMDGVIQVERLDERRKIVGVRVQVVAVPRLARAAMAASVMRDATVSMRCQKEHLVFKGVGGEWSAVAEDYGLTRAPVVVIDLRAVFGRDGAHCFASLFIDRGRQLAVHFDCASIG